MPKDQNGDYRGIAFVEYSHQESVPYALQLFIGSKLHSRPMNMRSRNNSNPVPLTPQYIEANNPLTAPGHSSRYNNNGHMQPHDGVAMAEDHHRQEAILLSSSQILPC